MQTFAIGKHRAFPGNKPKKMLRQTLAAEKDNGRLNGAGAQYYTNRRVRCFVARAVSIQERRIGHIRGISMECATGRLRGGVLDLSRQQAMLLHGVLDELLYPKNASSEKIVKVDIYRRR